MCISRSSAIVPSRVGRGNLFYQWVGATCVSVAQLAKSLHGSNGYVRGPSGH